MLPRTRHLLSLAHHVIAGSFALAIFAFGALALDADGDEARVVRQSVAVMTGERELGRTVCAGHEISDCVDLPEVEVAALRAEVRDRLG